MARINEIKEQKIVVQSVGDFSSSLQQIAAARMVKLRRLVMASRRFVDETTRIMLELQIEKSKHKEAELKSTQQKRKEKHKQEKETPNRTGIIVVSSDQGLAGSYNTEIVKKIESIFEKYKEADYYVIGKKGQDFFVKLALKKGAHYFPYNIPEEVKIEHLKPIIGMFHYYNELFLIYSKYINTTTREVVFLKLAVPTVTAEEVETTNEGKFIFEPGIDQLLRSIATKLRYAMFRQQILDSKLSLYSAQMIAMQTASDNAIELLKDLQMQYNKARRKEIDKKIQEVQAGRALWADE